MKPSPLVVRALLALSFLSAPAARAAITPEARVIADRYIEASGGRAAWERTRSMRFTGTITAFGLKGRMELSRQPPDRRASEVAIGPFQLKDWTSGDKSWRVDPSGKLLALDGKDLEQSLTGAWFENERWLEPDQGGGSVTAAGETKDSLGTRAVLEVTPPSGRPRRFEFDRKSGLLVRSVAKSDQNVITVTNSNFRKVDGYMMSFRSVQEVSGAAANTAIVDAESVWTAVIHPEGRFVPPVAEASKVTWLKTPGVARIPFEYLSNHVWVRAAVNGGPPADFIYDTGASVTVIDSGYAAKIGLATSGSMQATGAGAAGGASFANVDRLRIQAADGDGVELRDLKTAVLSVNSILAPFFWRECAGIIGFDTIVQFVNEIDFDGRMLTFHDPKPFRYAGKGAELPMTLAGHAPVVKVKVDGQYEGGARLDVGSGSTLDLHTPFVNQHGLIAKNPGSITVVSGGFGGTFESKLARMRTLEIGPYKVERPLIGLSTITTGALASEDYAGNLGNRLLDRFKLTLDYERRKVYLEPGAKFAATEPFSRFGAQLAKFGDEVRVAQILPRSPAAAAGLKNGDLIVSIDEVPIAQLDPGKLEAKFEHGKVGQKVAVTVLRDGKEKKLKVTLREIL
ncbi:MAG: PDZ domain-containing protein [Candidatus Eisenbacteria bacterium]